MMGVLGLFKFFAYFGKATELLFIGILNVFIERNFPIMMKFVHFKYLICSPLD